jgi:hypothetical protein
MDCGMEDGMTILDVTQACGYSRSFAAQNRRVESASTLNPRPSPLNPSHVATGSSSSGTISVSMSFASSDFSTISSLTMWPSLKWMMRFA